MNCRFDHDDPTRLPHRCNATCQLTLAECAELMRTQPIYIPRIPVEAYRPKPTQYAVLYRLPEPVDGFYPARTFVPKMV